MIWLELSRETNGYGFKIKGVHQRGTVIPRFSHSVIVTGLSGRPSDRKALTRKVEFM